MPKSLLQAAPKAPIGARGFQIQCNKWAVIVRLLLVEIPERTVFMQKGMKKALTPYFELTNAGQIGDLELFRTVAEKFSGTFNSDRMHYLIVRLRHNVIRTGLHHGNGWIVSKETGDIYSTNEPQIAFNSRIVFCLNMHNEAVRALRFPPNSHKEKESAEKRQERQKQEFHQFHKRHFRRSILKRDYVIAISIVIVETYAMVFGI
ncbi:putative 26S proteasome non-ATPase regulatory subunit 3 [Cocos nucifera]|nr:putative 26S proteasome non-ATPase regulatory subunit 3 [Cocos nucifera]